MKATYQKFLNQNQKKKSWKRNENLKLFKKSILNKILATKKDIASGKKSFNK